MVFCYKILTETPLLRARSVSPRKSSPMARYTELPESVSNMIRLFRYEDEKDIFKDIPEKEWRILQCLARKRDKIITQNKLAEELRKMWEKDKLQNDLLESELSEQYKIYLNRKREDQRLLHQMRTDHLRDKEKQKQITRMDAIRYKDMLAAERLASYQDDKAHKLIENVIDDHARAILAADRRYQREAAAETRRHAELMDDLGKLDAARSRRKQRLKVVAQRAAITNALSNWEASLVKQEVTSMEMLKRIQHAAHAELTNIRSEQLERAKKSRIQRAKHIASFTSELRLALIKDSDCNL